VATFARIARRRPLTTSLALLLGAAEIAYRCAPAHIRMSVSGWASTNVANLTHEPVGPILGSAFVVEQHQVMWFVLAVGGSLALEGRVGGRRALAVIVASHVLGTAVSEGIVWWRIDHGSLPLSARHLDDVGVSYIAVGLLTAVLLAASWRWKLPAAVTLIALAGSLLQGISRLDVTAVGHLAAAFVGGVGGFWVAPDLASKQGRNAGERKRKWNRRFRSTRTFSQL
jgi:hypothetical protein